MNDIKDRIPVILNKLNKEIKDACKKRKENRCKACGQRVKKIDLHELTIRVENAEAKVEECYKSMNKALEQLNALTTMLPKIQKCCDRLGI